MQKRVEVEVGCFTVTAIGDLDVTITSRPSRATRYYPGDPIEWEVEVCSVEIEYAAAGDIEGDVDWPTYDRIIDTVTEHLKELVTEDEVMDIYYYQNEERC